VNALGQTAPVRPRVIKRGWARGLSANRVPIESGATIEYALSMSARTVPEYILEQDHRFVKKRVAAGLWFRTG